MDMFLTAIGGVAFFVATICKDAGWYPKWVKVVRIVGAVLLALWYVNFLL